MSGPRNECIQCGICLEVCPLLRVTGREELSPRAKGLLAARLDAGEEILRPRSVAELAGLCLGCNRCRVVCPQGVDVPGLVGRMRAGSRGFLERIWGLGLLKAGPLWRVLGLAEGFAPERFGLMLKGLTAVAGQSELRPWLTRTRESCVLKGQRVLLFAGCAARFLAPRWEKTARSLLAGLGLDVLGADFGCCGGSLGVAGLGVAQAEARRRNVAAWRTAGRGRIVTLCASCLSGLRDAADTGLFEGEAERSAWLAALTPLSSLLDAGDFAVGADAPRRAAYHRPCHAPGDDPDLKFLAAALGARLARSTQKECCGFGGVMQLGAPGLAATVSRECWAALGREPGLCVLTGCSGCAMRLSATAPEDVSAGHWLDAVAPVG